MFRATLRHSCAVLGLILLAACGNVAEPVGQAPSQSPGSPAPRPAVVTAAPAPATPAASAAPTQPAALPSADPTTAAPGAIGEIPESTTAEGYHILGRADAPVTLTMYSDFL